jgi:CBS domain-containing protein
MPTVRDVMTTDLITIEPSETVAQAATKMGRSLTGSALVLNGGELAGIFTERDIVKALGTDFDAAGHTVSEWMTADPVTVDPNVDAGEALQWMLAHGFRHFPVVDGAGALLGIVSIRDLSRAVTDQERPGP